MMAAASTSSSRVRGNSRPFGVPVIVCPDRPTRWISVAMALGEPIWQTRSTEPMSIPSSREAVATRAFSAPAFSRCSASCRCSFDMLPWWEVTFSAPSRSLRWRASRSDMLRVVTKTSVVRCRRMSSSRRSYTSSHTSFDMTAPRGERGTSIFSSSLRRWPVLRTLHPFPFA